MKNRPRRAAYHLPALIGVVLFGVVAFGISASAGVSSPAGGGRQPLKAAASLSNLAWKKSGKLSPRLQQLSRPAAIKTSAKAQAAAIGLPASGAGSLLRVPGRKQLIVYVRVSGSIASASEAIKNAGATIIDASGRYGVVTATVDPSRLQALGKLPAVDSAQEALAPMQAAACPSGPVVSEGDSQLAAASARSIYGVDGSGVTVGVLSDSYNYRAGASTGVSAGELPGVGNPCGKTTPVNVLQDFISSGSTDEGRAMLEVVHDLAPGASLAFATAETGIYGMAANIRALRNAGAKVIADDITYLNEPMFQKSPIDVAIDDVTSSGVSYFSSAGNENTVVGGHNVGSYEAPAYRPTSCPATVNNFATSHSFSYLDCHDFDPGTGVDNGAGYTLASGASLPVDLQWAEPWGGVKTDLDLFVIDVDTGNLLSYSTARNAGASGTQEPFEWASSRNTTGAPENVEVVIARYSGTALPRLKYVLWRPNLTSAEYNSSSGGDVVGPTIIGHNGGQNTITVAAVPYNSSTTPERYTSHGPVTYYFGPVNGTTPAAPLSSPLVLSKPDIAATDCAQTSFFSGNGPPYYFCGTSEAAPHAAAVAALMLQHDPTLTPASVRSRLQASGRPVANGGSSDVVGSGLINAVDAVGSLALLAFSQSSYSISGAGTSATVTINRTGNTSSAISVRFATANGTATAGSDYTAVSQDVSFAASVTSQTVSIPITDRGLVSGSKTVSLSLSSPSLGATLGSPSAATLTIVDNDASFVFSQAYYSVGEGAGSAQVTIERTGNTSSAVSVHFATVNGTATAGSDYAAVSKTVTFAAGETSKTSSVPIKDDRSVERTEALTLILSDPSTSTELDTATLTIVDNDRASAGSSGSGKISAHLTKKSFKYTQARKIKLVVKFSPQSKKFNYLLSFRQNGMWLTVKSVKRTGTFTGARTTTVKSLFKSKAVESGSYRLKLSADKNSKTLSFRVT